MGFTIASDDSGRSRIVVLDEPDFIVPLRIAPLCLEDYLKQGRWLVVSMSVWSVYDFRAGHRAMELVKLQKGLVKLGLRPFDYSNEILTWVPEVRFEPDADRVDIFVAEQEGWREVTIQGMPDASPIWVSIIEGQIVQIRFGNLADAEIEQLILHLLGG